MKVLITGGNGYVGRTLTRKLYGHHDVTVLDNVRSGLVRFTPAERSRFRFAQHDIGDYESVRALISETRPEIIVHLAAIHYIPQCESDPEEAVRTNTLGTMNMLRACEPGTRFVFASTAAVYAAENTPHDELSSPIGPTDVYGLTKLHAESYVRYYAKKSQLDARIIRLFNVVGPGETNPHVLPAILAQALAGVRTLRLGNCTPRRDYIHVSDAAEGFIAVALRAKNGSPHVDVVNVGTGNSYSVYELVAKLGEITGQPFKIETDSARLRQADRPFAAACTHKAAQDYGWSARYRIEDSLRDLWQNPDIPADLLARS